MTPGLFIDNEGHIVARIQNGALIGEADPVVQGWFKNGVPGLAGVHHGRTIVEHTVIIPPSDLFFLLAVMEAAEARDWTVVDETDDADQKSGVGDKLSPPFAT